MNMVKECRVQKLWTQRHLAKKAGVSEWTIRMAEKGTGAANWITQEKISRAFGLPRDIVFPKQPEEAAV